MNSPAAVRQAVATYVFDRLEPRGFIRTGIFFRRAREHGIYDSIVLPSVIPDKGGPIYVSANVGIYVAQLHAILDNRAGATFLTNIGYVLPAKSWTDWEFDRGVFSESSARELFGALTAYGLPFLEQFRTHDDVIRGFESYGVASENREMHLGLRLLGSDRKRVLAEIQERMHALRGRQEAYAVHQMGMLTRLLAYASTQEP